ncbi:MAG TPA: hypothetical protein VL588_03305, partial [Bdellovibrionota bacterium]|nr:hypothetical protein [Bdellovibrionota bacterium]
MGAWMFVDGAGLIKNMILPFSTNNLRVLCTGYAAALAVLFCYQSVYWLMIRRGTTALSRVVASAITDTANATAAAAPAQATAMAGAAPDVAPGTTPTATPGTAAKKVA